MLRTFVALSSLVLALVGCASMGPFFPPDPTPFPPDFDRADCCLD